MTTSQTMFDALVEDLGGMQEFLASQTTTMSSDAMDTYLFGQVHVFQLRIRRMTGMRAQDGTTLNAKFNEGPWTDEHKNMLRQCVTETVTRSTVTSVGSDGGSVRRRPNSKCVYPQNYVVKDESGVISSDVSMTIKFQTVAKRFKKVNLDIPDEPTLSRMLAYILLMSGRQWNARQQFDMREDFKKMYKQEMKTMERRVSYVAHMENYPETPDFLPTELFHAAYGEDPEFVVCQYSADEVNQLATSIPERRTHRALRVALSPMQHYGPLMPISAARHAMPGQAESFQQLDFASLLSQAFASAMGHQAPIDRQHGMVPGLRMCRPPDESRAGAMRRPYADHRAGELPAAERRADAAVEESQIAVPDEEEEEETKEKSEDDLQQPQLQGDDAAMADATALMDAMSGRKDAAAAAAAAAMIAGKPPKSKGKGGKGKSKGNGKITKKGSNIKDAKTPKGKDKGNGKKATVGKGNADVTSAKSVDPGRKARQIAKNAKTSAAYNTYMSKKNKGTVAVPSVTQRVRLLPGGCSKCRYSDGCSTSCWEYRLGLK
jgi:hypothetical protein